MAHTSVVGQHDFPWHYGAMPKRSTPKRDFMEVARSIVEQAIGEQMDGKPLKPPPEDHRNPQAVARGRLGGTKGGKARATALGARRRSAIARKAAKKRWSSSSGR